MLDVTHGRAQMDKLRQELDQCFTAPVFDRTRFATLTQEMKRLLRDGITGTPVEQRLGTPRDPNPTDSAVKQRDYRARLAVIRRANVIERRQNTGSPANADQG